MSSRKIVALLTVQLFVIFRYVQSAEVPATQRLQLLSVEDEIKSDSCVLKNSVDASLYTPR